MVTRDIVDRTGQITYKTEVDDQRWLGHANQQKVVTHVFC